MARLPRLAVAGQAHLALMLGHGAQPVFADDSDRQQFLAALRESALQHAVALHAYALLPDRVLLLLTPGADGALGALMQSLGRRYGAAFNRRHGRRGSLWAGRFRTAVVQPGQPLLEAMLFVDLHAARGAPAEPAGVSASADVAPGLAAGAVVAAVGDAGWSSAAHRLGQRRDAMLSDCSAWWGLGNTPFEREASYRRLLAEGLDAARWGALADAVHKGWAVGDAAFLSALAAGTSRPLQPRRRGRPPRESPAG